MTAAEAKRAYMREWRQRNPDKVKANSERYWKRKAQAADEAAQEAKADKSAGESNGR